MLKTVKGIIRPNGKIDLDDFEIPQFPIRVIVTILDEDLSKESKLSEVGDYLEQLENYEEALAKGQVQWK
ncbi:MAG: hypothetical protein NUV74_01350 [Candidatus Brocadiaceae bacterium]|jgi:hypothetical protein|nr:hypothetical protein [Candidatus Brocadiaceae bacterium]HLE86150.1 hypothetical protein [Candidatus Brocadiaceae bacterium]